MCWQTGWLHIDDSSQQQVHRFHKNNWHMEVQIRIYWGVMWCSWDPASWSSTFLCNAGNDLPWLHCITSTVLLTLLTAKLINLSYFTAWNNKFPLSCTTRNGYKCQLYLIMARLFSGLAWTFENRGHMVYRKTNKFIL